MSGSGWGHTKAAAAGSQPPNITWVNDPAWSTFASAWQVNANYMMIHEHYLDFSYAPILHRRDVPLEIASMPAFNDVEVTETTVSCTRLLPDAQLTDWEADATGLDRGLTYKRREGGTFVSPAVHRQYWEITAANGELYTTTRTHAITPETEASTHVFMQASRNYRLNDNAVTERLTSFLAEVAQRDIAILDMASNHSGYDGWRGGVEFRRIPMLAGAPNRWGDVGERSGPIAVRPVSRPAVKARLAQPPSTHQGFRNPRLRGGNRRRSVLRRSRYCLAADRGSQVFRLTRD